MGKNLKISEIKNKEIPAMKKILFIGVLLVALAFSGCGSPAVEEDTTAPVVNSIIPANLEEDVSTSGNVRAMFSEELDETTITSSSFTLARGATPVPGEVTYAGSIATFNPTAILAVSTVYTATVTTAVLDLAGNPLAADKVWTFTTAAAPDTVAPTVSSTVPADSDTDVARNRDVTATFNEEMDSDTITALSFTLVRGTTSIPGEVTYSGKVASFNPSAELLANTVYTATITTGAEDLAGNALAANEVWVFRTGENLAAGPAPVELGTAGNFVALAKTGISTTGTTAIVGDLGVSPAAASYITGFSLILDASNVFATSSVVTGKIYAADYTPPTPSNMTTAIGDMEIAYTDAAARTLPDATELYDGDLSGRTITPGLYKWGTGVLINGNVTLAGGANDVWIFQIAQDLTVGNGAMVTLSGGAQPKNIFWQIAGQTTLGTTSDFKGIILCKTLIEVNTGAALNGRALAQTAITLDANALTQPSL